MNARWAGCLVLGIALVMVLWPEPEAAEAQVDAERRAAEAVAKIRRLPVEAFPDLPETIAEALRMRSCRVPQPSPDGARRNVIRGEFFKKGESGWAALCSVDNSTAILVFRNDRDSNPDRLASREDRYYAMESPDGRPVYLREIIAVNRDFILKHHRAYGGPEPPPIDHQGIDEGILEKASITRYFHQGKWLELTGAD